MEKNLLPELEPASWLRGWALAGAVLAMLDVALMVTAVVLS